METALNLAVYKRTLEKNGKPIAAFLVAPLPRPRARGMRHVMFEYDPRARKEAMAWIKQELVAARRYFTPFSFLGLASEDSRKLDRALLQAGFHHHSAMQLGNPVVALRRLVKVKNPPREIPGLEIRPVRSRLDCIAAIRLQKRVFTRIPGRGWFSHTRRGLLQDKNEYISSLEKKSSEQFLVFRGKRLVGFFGCYRGKCAAGRIGGFTFCFSPEIQGQGVVKTAYLLLLEGLVKRKVPFFKGGTSQPAVRGLGKIMKRRVTGHLYMQKKWD